MVECDDRSYSVGPTWLMPNAVVCNTQGDSDREGETDPPSPKTPRTQNGDAQTTGVSADAPAAPPKTPELSRNQSALACFGLGGKVAVGEDDGEEVENSKGSKGADSEAMPAGTVGLRNIGTDSCHHRMDCVMFLPAHISLILVPEMVYCSPLPCVLCIAVNADLGKDLSTDADCISLLLCRQHLLHQLGSSGPVPDAWFS